MIDLVTIVAFALLVLAVVGSVLPSMPGAPLSVVGVLVYWWGSGFSEPGPLVLVGLVAVGLGAWAVDALAGPMAAKVGGASTRTAVLAGVVALALFFVTGPLGILLGVALTVFAVEFYQRRDARGSARAAFFTTVGMLGSVVVQALLTGSILVTMVAIAVW
ncbi:MAG: DUF456 domain-containing protein [Haloarculaceae archaeon]